MLNVRKIVKKDQFIALCADSKEEGESLLGVVKWLSDRLKKGVIVFTCSEDGKEWVGSLGHPYAALKGSWADAVEAMPTAFNVVLAVAAFSPHAPRKSMGNPRQLLENFKESKVAYLAVPAEGTSWGEGITHPKVALTLDHQRESKEKLLWASYMARFCGGEIDVYHLAYRDADFRRRLENNIKYLDKVFGYRLHALESRNQYGHPDRQTVKDVEYDLFISLVEGQRDRDLLDVLLPSESLRLLRTTEKPILFLNQRDDLYAMCD